MLGFLLRHRALTVLELLIALTLIAVVSTAGVPMFRDLVMNTQRRSDLDSLLGAVDFARSTALTRQTTAVLCQSSDLRTCADSQTDGKRWIVALPADTGTGQIAAAPLRQITLRSAGTVSGNRLAWHFRAFPRHSTNGTLAFCDPRGAEAQRAIVISATGRPRLIAPPDVDGFSACQTD